MSKIRNEFVIPIRTSDRNNSCTTGAAVIENIDSSKTDRIFSQKLKVPGKMYQFRICFFSNKFINWLVIAIVSVHLCSFSRFLQ